LRLTNRQKRFIDEYLVDMNGTGAAIRAGYSPRTARSIASENLRKPEISVEVARRIRGRKRETAISAEAVLEHLKAIALSNIGDLMDEEGNILEPAIWPNHARLAVQSFRRERRLDSAGRTVEYVSVQMRDSVSALRLYLKHIGVRG
jgi:phage terminase small subunit